MGLGGAQDSAGCHSATWTASFLWGPRRSQHQLGTPRDRHQHQAGRGREAEALGKPLLQSAGSPGQLGSPTAQHTWLVPARVPGLITGGSGTASAQGGAAWHSQRGCPGPSGSSDL